MVKLFDCYTHRNCDLAVKVRHFCFCSSILSEHLQIRLLVQSLSPRPFCVECSSSVCAELRLWWTSFQKESKRHAHKATLVCRGCSEWWLWMPVGVWMWPWDTLSTCPGYNPVFTAKKVTENQTKTKHTLLLVCTAAPSFIICRQTDLKTTIMVQDSQGRVNLAAQSKSVALVFSQLFIKRDYLAWWMGATELWQRFHSLNPGLPASDRTIWRWASPAVQWHAGKRKPRQMSVDGHLRTPQERQSRLRRVVRGCVWCVSDCGLPGMG